MNLRFVLVLATAVLATGCASMRDPSVATASAPANRDTDDASALYIQRVEQQARSRGIGVTWVNPPHKRTRIASTPR
ncbi:hypothetical protein [Lysobacter xanthus]